MGRKSFTAEFKAKVAIEALKGNQTINELSSEFGVHSTQITTWKKNLIQAGKQAFSGKKQQGQRDAYYHDVGHLLLSCWTLTYPQFI